MLCLKMSKNKTARFRQLKISYWILWRKSPATGPGLQQLSSAHPSNCKNLAASRLQRVSMPNGHDPARQFLSQVFRSRKSAWWACSSPDILIGLEGLDDARSSAVITVIHIIQIAFRVIIADQAQNNERKLFRKRFKFPFQSACFRHPNWHWLFFPIYRLFGYN